VGEKRKKNILECDESQFDEWDIKFEEE